MLSNKDVVIYMIVDNGLTLFHISHAMQVPCDSSTRGVQNCRYPSKLDKRPSMVSWSPFFLPHYISSHESPGRSATAQNVFFFTLEYKIEQEKQTSTKIKTKHSFWVCSSALHFEV
jgi:hypothetical protein